MGQYTVRIELHNASYLDYENLHAEMGRRGFSQTIRGDNGRLYKLPTAEYDITSSASIDQIRAAGAAAVASTGRTGMVLVSQATARAWQGLPQLA
jgi:hypothetical protein